MTDLRAQIEALPIHQRHNGFATSSVWVDRKRVLALIPEGSVLVTRETLDQHVPVMESSDYGLRTWLSCDCGFDEKLDGARWESHLRAALTPEPTDDGTP
jgi:hypothetical protein